MKKILFVFCSLIILLLFSAGVIVTPNHAIAQEEPANCSLTSYHIDGQAFRIIKGTNNIMPTTQFARALPAPVAQDEPAADTAIDLWLDDQEQPGRAEMDAAVLVVDDFASPLPPDEANGNLNFTHGTLVRAGVDQWLATFNAGQIPVVPVEIDFGTADTATILNAIEQSVRAVSGERIIVNMSFAIIPCEITVEGEFGIFVFNVEGFASVYSESGGATGLRQQIAEQLGIEISQQEPSEEVNAVLDAIFSDEGVVQSEAQAAFTDYLGSVIAYGEENEPVEFDLDGDETTLQLYEMIEGVVEGAPDAGIFDPLHLFCATHVLLNELTETTVETPEVICVGAAGNQGRAVPYAPAVWPSVTAVSATENGVNRSVDSNSGEVMTLIGPYVVGGLGVGGTSMAATHVSAMFAVGCEIDTTVTLNDTLVQTVMLC